MVIYYRLYYNPTTVSFCYEVKLDSGLQKGNRSNFVLCLVFSVVCYLAMFCLDDLGLDHFSRIIKSLDISKMHKVSKTHVLYT